jgi:hypothetical protein
VGRAEQVASAREGREEAGAREADALSARSRAPSSAGGVSNTSSGVARTAMGTAGSSLRAQRSTVRPRNRIKRPSPCPDGSARGSASSRARSPPKPNARESAARGLVACAQRTLNAPAPRIELTPSACKLNTRSR